MILWQYIDNNNWFISPNPV